MTVQHSLKPLPEKVPVFGIEHHRTTVSVGCGSRFCIRLYENPGSGYRWNVNLTNGLKTLDSWFAPTVPVREESGGMHMWSVRAVGDGEQIIRAVYQQHGEDTLRQPLIYQLFLKVV